jgi:hypothetical protein
MYKTFTVKPFLRNQQEYFSYLVYMQIKPHKLSENPKNFHLTVPTFTDIPTACVVQIIHIAGQV